MHRGDEAWRELLEGFLARVEAGEATPDVHTVKSVRRWLSECEPASGEARSSEAEQGGGARNGLEDADLQRQFERYEKAGLI